MFSASLSSQVNNVFVLEPCFIQTTSLCFLKGRHRCASFRGTDFLPVSHFPGAIFSCHISHPHTATTQIWSWDPTQSGRTPHRKINPKIFFFFFNRLWIELAIGVALFQTHCSTIRYTNIKRLKFSDLLTVYIVKIQSSLVIRQSSLV